MSRFRPHPGGVLDLAVSYPFVPSPVVLLPAATLVAVGESVAPIWRVLGAIVVLLDVVLLMLCALVRVDITESGMRVRNCIRTVTVPFDADVTISVNEFDTTKFTHTWKSGLLTAYGSDVPGGIVHIQATCRLRHAQWERLREDLATAARPRNVRFDHDYNAKYAARWQRR